MARKCLKCGYERLPTDSAPDYECPKCGAIYAKVEATLSINTSKDSLTDEEKIKVIKEKAALQKIGAKSKPTIAKPQKQAASRTSSEEDEASDNSGWAAQWIKQRPCQIAVALICLMFGLLVTVWFGDQRSAPVQVLSAKPSGVADQFNQPTKLSEDQLRDAINASQGRVIQLQAEYDEYSGGLIRALLGSALAAEKHTFAMLNQKQESWIHRIALDYTVDGTAYRAPQNAEERIAAIESEIETAKGKLAHSQAEADRYSGGLVRATLLSAVATQQMSLAMLEQKRASLKFGFPLYAVNSELPAKQSGSSAAKRELDWSIVKIESRVTESNKSWHKHAWRLEIQNNEEIPLTFNAKIEFQDSDGFVIDDDRENGLYVAPNSTKTFTGSTLISVPGAYKVAKTNAKVGLK